MESQELLPNLFRTEYRKIVAVLCAVFGIDHIETAEDIVSDTFLAATELWGVRGVPVNPTAWLYAVAKNKARNHLKRNSLFANSITAELQRNADVQEELVIDLSDKSINDSQLAMIFTICNSCIPVESQIALSLNLLCGFGIQEIADALLVGKEAVYKKLSRAKHRLRAERIAIEQPSPSEVARRLPTVLTTLYLLFSEGHYSSSQNTILRQDLCAEAMRLAYMLVQNAGTDTPGTNALLALMCFHSSRFSARVNASGHDVLYEDQDAALWDTELIAMGEHFLNRASTGNQLSKYHLEAGIAYWHTHKADTAEKWENILQLYNQLLLLEYSPIAALNRTYALAKANGYAEAIAEAEKLNLGGNHLYHCLLAHLYSGTDAARALHEYRTALSLTSSAAEKEMIRKKIEGL